MISSARRDNGQTTVLTIGYAVVALLLVTVVVNLSKVFLAQRALDAVADEAALAAAQAVSTGPYYDEGTGEYLPLSSQSAADQAVARHLSGYDEARICHGFRVDDVATNGAGTSVSVVVSCRVRIPFANVVSGSYADGVPLESRATARQAIRP